MKKCMKELIKVDSKMFRKLFYITIIVLLNTSCKSQSNITNNSNKDLELILQDNYSGFEKEEILLMKDQKSLEKFFGRINRTRKPSLPIPKINFSKEMVLIWCAGETYATIPELSISRAI